MRNISQSVTRQWEAGEAVPTFCYPIILDDTLWSLGDAPGNLCPVTIVRLAAEAVDFIASFGDESDAVEFSVQIETHRGPETLQLRVSWTVRRCVSIAPVAPAPWQASCPGVGEKALATYTSLFQ